jgi:long-chain acyl-CoA synthetase
MSDWNDLDITVRREVHFGDRIVHCIANRPATYFDMIEKATAERPHAEALISGDLRLTWIQLRDRCLGFARGLLSRSVKQGDRVAFLISNGAEFCIAYFACARIGAIIVPINTREQADGIAYFLDHSGAVAVIHDADLADRLPRNDGRLRIAPGRAGTSVDFADIHVEDEAISLPMVREEDLISINYTSGTTGKPKGVTFTHLGVVHAAMQYALCIGLQPDDRSVVAIPLSFTGGMISALSPMIYCGGAVVVLKDFKAADFLKVAAQERMTHTLMVPTMYELCLRQDGVAGRDLSQWVHGVFGAAPMPVATLQRLAEQFPNLRLMNSYGATEAGGPSTFMRPEDTEANLDAVGRAFPCVNLAVIDEHGEEVPLGETGELWIHSPGCSPGFWNDPERTALEYFGGWWKSGDIATLDANGLVRLVDRKKDMINRGGYKIASLQVEEILYQHPDIVECAVVGKPDPVLGERVQAFIWAQGANLGEAELQEFCRHRLADYKVPEVFVFTKQPLPRNANGKVLKRELRGRLSG